MRNPRRLACLLSFSAAALTALAAATGCVTVNVNFPEAAVQQATDDYVRDLYKAKEKSKPTPSSTDAAKPTSSLWSAFESSAWADVVDGVIRTNSSRADQIKQRQAARLDEITADKRKGILGETSDGTLVIKDPSKVGSLLLKKVEKTVADENSDRKELYIEVQKLNGADSNGLARIKKSFARSFQAASPSGTWIQENDGSWSQKP